MSEAWTDEDSDDAASAYRQRPAPQLALVSATTPRNWRELLIFERAKGQPERCANHVANVVTILRHHEDWTWPDGSSKLHLDEHQGQVFVTQPPWDPVDADGPIPDHPVPWRDSDDVRLSSWLRRSTWGLKVDEGTCQSAVNAVAETNRVNPWMDYLNGLRWDGTERLRHVLADYFGVEPGEYASSVFRWWILSAVARTYQPGCKADYVLILEGSQGIKKSQALKAIAGRRYFSDTPINIGDKDAYVRLQGLVIVELAEFRIDSKAAKAFFSSDTDKFRPPYARRDITQPRRCIFAATINPKGTYLNDPTGARRFWPVECHEIQLSTLHLVRDQLWAEATAIYKAGLACGVCASGGPEWRCADHRWWPETAEDHALCARQQAHRTHADAWEDLVEAWCAMRDEVTIAEVLEGACKVPRERLNGVNRDRAEVILAGLGYVREGKVWRRVSRAR